MKQGTIANSKHDGSGLFASSKFLLLVFWAAAQCFYFMQHGIVTTGEAEKYIREAHLFVQTGKLSSPNFWLYFSEILLLSICIKLRIGFFFIIGVQLFLNLMAAYSFYKTLLRFSGYRRLALMGIILLLINQPYQEFNFYLQTESIFYSLTLLYSCYLLKTETLTIKSVLVILALSFVLMITRPTGLLFVPATLVYVFLISLYKISRTGKLAAAGFFFFAFLYILNKALSSGGELDLMLPFKNQSVICGVISPGGSTNINTSGESSSLFSLFYFVTHNFSLFIQLAFQKTQAFFGLYRSYFSTGHNLFLVVYFYSLYIMSAGSILYWKKTKPLVFVYIATLLLITWVSVMLTCDDWHNRFFLTLTPYFILMSVIFVSGIQNKFRHPKKSKND